MMPGFAHLPAELRLHCYRLARLLKFRDKIRNFEKKWRPPLFLSSRGGFLDAIGTHHALVLDDSGHVIHHFYLDTHYLGHRHAHLAPTGLQCPKRMHRYGFRPHVGPYWYMFMHRHLLPGDTFKYRWVHCVHSRAPGLLRRHLRRFQTSHGWCPRNHEGEHILSYVAAP